VPSDLPDGDPVPSDGSLPASAFESFGELPFGFYVHVPFCTVRCGYCDFNTYTASELGSGPGASRASYADAAVAEIRLARSVLGDVAAPVDTIFFGGGTPTLLPPADLTRIVAVIDEEFGLVPGAEVTTESNPDSVSAHDLGLLREGGINRISFGMQSAVLHVLAVLDRTHDPRRVPQVVQWARSAGFDEVSLDLIYGTPGESLEDWATSLDSALSNEPDHVSAYALIVEEGTALARQIRRGEVKMTDDDDLADKYIAADEAFTKAGLGWYEVSNWSRSPESRCRHNMGYWTGGDWWGVGPGAHSHVGGVRWWNVKHPTAYAGRIEHGSSPAHAREVLDDETRRVERVLLELRLRDGLAIDVLDDAGRANLPAQIERGLVSAVELERGRVVLTPAGRLLADAVVRDLS